MPDCSLGAMFWDFILVEHDTAPTGTSLDSLVLVLDCVTVFSRDTVAVGEEQRIACDVRETCCVLDHAFTSPRRIRLAQRVSRQKRWTLYTQHHVSQPTTRRNHSEQTESNHPNQTHQHTNQQSNQQSNQPLHAPPMVPSFCFPLSVPFLHHRSTSNEKMTLLKVARRAGRREDVNNTLEEFYSRPSTRKPASKELTTSSVLISCASIKMAQTSDHSTRSRF